jgi:hypothetical protein
MSRAIDLSRSEYRSLNITPEPPKNSSAQKNKGWSFINIYHLVELRNIYLALKRYSFQGGIKNFSTFCSGEVPFENKPWTYRKVEEYLNALRNFQILNPDNTIQEGVFSDKPMDMPLDEDDHNSLRRIFYTYFRFKEIHAWFLDIHSPDRKTVIQRASVSELTAGSHPIFAFSYNSRFKDAFISALADNATIVYLDNNVSIARQVMRLWDVYIQWGKTLGVLEYFSLQQVGITLTHQSALSCYYHLDDGAKFESSLYDLMRSRYGKKKVFVPELVFALAIEMRISIRQIHDFIIEEYKTNRELFSLDNTSEIFISRKKFRQGEVILFPIYRDSYISHITITK